MGQHPTPLQGKSPRELYISETEETLIVILLVNIPPPSEEILLVSNIYLTKRITSLDSTRYSSPLPPSTGNFLVNFISLTKRKHSLQFYCQSTLPPARRFSS